MSVQRLITQRNPLDARAHGAIPASPAPASSIGSQTTTGGQWPTRGHWPSHRHLSSAEPAQLLPPPGTPPRNVSVVDDAVAVNANVWLLQPTLLLLNRSVEGVALRIARCADGQGLDTAVRDCQRAEKVTR